MKKTIQLLFVSLLIIAFTSCSSDNDSATTAVLLKKLTSVTMGKHAEYNFQYNGTQLSKVTFDIEAQTDGRGYDKYTYSNNLITEIKRYNASNQNMAITYLTYDSSNRLTEALTLQLSGNYGLKRVFTHNLNGTVTVTAYSGNLETQNTPSDIVETYHFQNGEVSRKDFVSNALSFTVTYSYDSANHPMKNVAGIKQIKLYTFIADGLFGMEHNITRTVSVTGADTVQVDMEVDYNTNNYPVLSYSDSGDQYQFEYFK